MKAFTDIQQSKKLAGILPIESADMCFNTHNNMPPLMTPYSRFKEFYNMEPTPAFLIPCWSLGALLGYLNQNWYVYLSHDGICWQCVIDHHDRKERHCSSVLTDEPIDCCVELIVKLKEENLI